MSVSVSESASVVREIPKSTINRAPPSIVEETPDEAKSTKQTIGDMKISPEVAIDALQQADGNIKDVNDVSFKAGPLVISEV